MPVDEPVRPQRSNKFLPVEVIGEVLSFAAVTFNDVYGYALVSARWWEAATSSVALWSQDCLVHHRWKFDNGVHELLCRSHEANVVEHTIAVECVPTNLTEVHLFGLNLHEIGEGFFAKSPKLVSCTFRNLPNLRSIGGSFLADVPALSHVDFSGFTSVASIGLGFLRNCTSLTSFDSRGLRSVTAIEDFFLAGCTSLSHFDGSELVSLSSVTDGFLMDCTSLQRFSGSGLGQLAKIGHNVLKNCSALTTFDSTGLAKLREIGSQFCRDCTSLTNIDTRGFTSVEEIDYGFCVNCTALQVFDRSKLKHSLRTGRNFLAGCTSLPDADSLEAVKRNNSESILSSASFSANSRAFSETFETEDIGGLEEIATAPDLDLLEALDTDTYFREKANLEVEIQQALAASFPPNSPLSLTQAAALRICTDRNHYGNLNKRLRSHDRAELETLRPFLKICLSALGILRDTALHGTEAPPLYYGTQKDNPEDYPEELHEGVFRWNLWCLTEEESLARSYAGKHGVFLVFKGFRDAAPVTGYSSQKVAKAWFMLPGVQLRATKTYKEGDLTVIELEQVEDTAPAFPPSLTLTEEKEKKKKKEGAVNPHSFSAPLEVTPINADSREWINAISGLDDGPQKSIEDAVKLDEELLRIFDNEKTKDGFPQRTEGSDSPLSYDQRVALWLYTGDELPTFLNSRLRDSEARRDESLFPFLKLLLGGLGELRDAAHFDSETPDVLYRGLGNVAAVSISKFGKGRQLFLWQLSSFSTDFEVAKEFITSEPPLYLTLLQGQDVCPVEEYSQYGYEHEWVLFPGILIEVEEVITHTDCADFPDGLVEVRIRQIAPPQVDYPPPPEWQKSTSYGGDDDDDL